MFTKGKGDLALWLILGLTFLLRAYGLPAQAWWAALAAVGSGYFLGRIALTLWGGDEAITATLFFALTPWAIIATRNLWIENLLLLAFLFTLWRFIEKGKSRFWLSALLLLLFLPLAVLGQKGLLGIDQTDVAEINRFRGWSWQTSLPWTGQVFANKATFFTFEVARRYFSYFDPSFLFFRGVFDPQFGIPDRGVMLLASLPLLFAGAVRIYSRKSFYPILVILALAPLPAAFSAAPLNTKVAYLLLAPFLLLAAAGLPAFLRRFAPKTVWLVLFSILAIDLIGFWHDLTFHFPP